MGLHRARFSGDGVSKELRFTAPTGHVSETFDRRRADRRIAIELDVSLGNHQSFYAGLSENLSVGGIFVATHLIRPVGELTAFSIYLPEQEKPVRGVGEVRWVRNYVELGDVPPGIGIRFVAIEPGGREAIERFLTEREALLYAAL